ncbi:MAG: hypothetical protein HYV39_02855 [Candidatus Levybacteria bacterium]|nr:hypothetical protein [Candidatus Levybacteria bacterium]
MVARQEQRFPSAVTIDKEVVVDPIIADPRNSLYVLTVILANRGFPLDVVNTYISDSGFAGNNKVVSASEDNMSRYKSIRQECMDVPRFRALSIAFMGFDISFYHGKNKRKIEAFSKEQQKKERRGIPSLTEAEIQAMVEEDVDPILTRFRYSKKAA